MADGIYESFNYTTFDENEFNNIEGSLTEIEIRKLKKTLIRKLNKKNTYIKAAVSIALISTIGITVATPAFAQSIVRYIPAMDTLYEKLGYYNEYKDFSQYIGSSKEIQGYKFTIDKLIADDDTVLVALRINKSGINANRKYINKENQQFMMTADLTGTNSGTIVGGSVDESILDNDTSLVLLENQSSPKKSLPMRFKIRINIHSIKDKNINVNFDLPVSREKIKTETIEKKKSGESSLNDGKVVINKLKASPINTNIYYSAIGSVNKDISGYVDFYTYDNNGRIYISTSSLSDDSGNTVATLDAIEKDAQKLYIVPYIHVLKSNDENNKSDKFDFYDKDFDLDTTREFDFKENGKIDVYKIQKDITTIKFYYNIIGAKNILDKRNIISLSEIQDEKNNEKIAVQYENMKIYKMDTGSLDSYCVEFDNIDINKQYRYNVGFDPNQKYVEGTPIEINLK